MPVNWSLNTSLNLDFVDNILWDLDLIKVVD